MRLLFLTALLIVCAGCANRVSRERFYQLCDQANATDRIVQSLPGRVFYQGTKNDFDYFLIDPSLEVSDQVAVKMGEISEVRRRFLYSRRRDRWVFLEFAVPAAPVESIWDPIWPSEGPPN